MNEKITKATIRGPRVWVTYDDGMKCCLIDRGPGGTVDAKSNDLIGLTTLEALKLLKPK